MEFVPQAMITGGFVVAQEVQLGEKVSREKLTRIFVEINDAGFPYGSFNMLAEGAGVQLQGPSPAEFVTIQPPLVQVQSVLSEGTTDAAARKAQMIVEIVARILNVETVLNLGIRVVYHAPLASNDGREFMLNRVLSFGGEHHQELELGGDLWGGVKYVATSPSGTVYTVQVEPSVADNMKSLYIEIDAQFPGNHRPDEIQSLGADVKNYVTEHLGRYLDNLIEPGSG